MVTIPVESKFSTRNLAIVIEAIELRNKTLQVQDQCGCSPWEGTVKPYNGWKEAGRYVRKGQKALCAVNTFVDRSHNKDNGETIRRKTPWRAFLFCFCQTEEEGIKS